MRGLGLTSLLPFPVLPPSPCRFLQGAIPEQNACTRVLLSGSASESPTEDRHLGVSVLFFVLKEKLQHVLDAKGSDLGGGKLTEQERGGGLRSDVLREQDGWSLHKGRRH